MMQPLLPLALAVAFALLLSPSRAEDWTVDGKDYHNVKVTKVDPDTVSITYDGGLGTVKLSDLTPELKKRFGYDPQAAQAAQHKKALTRAQADAELQQGLRLESIKVQYAAEIEKVSKSPLKLWGTIKRIDDGVYIIVAGGKQSAPVPHSNGITGVTTYTTDIDKTPMVLGGAGGMVALVSIAPYTVGESINLSVYNAGLQTGKGVYCLRYSDDPAVAFRLANNIK